MLTNERERRICRKYSAYDENRRVHCSECPLSNRCHDMPPQTCKAVMHYDRKKREWVPDETEEGKKNGKAE